MGGSKSQEACTGDDELWSDAEECPRGTRLAALLIDILTRADAGDGRDVGMC